MTVLEALLNRKSTPPRLMDDQGPSPADVQDMTCRGDDSARPWRHPPLALRHYRRRGPGDAWPSLRRSASPPGPECDRGSHRQGSRQAAARADRHRHSGAGDTGSPERTAGRTDRRRRVRRSEHAARGGGKRLWCNSANWQERPRQLT